MKITLAQEGAFFMPHARISLILKLLEVYFSMKRRILFAMFAFLLIMAVSASAFSGREKWQLQLSSPITSGISVSGNMLFFGSETGRIYAADKNTGRVIWEYKAENTIYGTPAVVKDSVVFAAGDGELLCLSISDGSLIWRAGGIGGKDTHGKDVNDGLSDGAAYGGGMLFVSKADRKLHALNASTGKTVWTYTGGDQGLREAPVYSDGLVFLGEYDGIFSIINAKTGKRENGGGAGGAVNTPTVSGGNVYFSAWNGAVNAVKIKGVEPLWEVNIHDAATTQPAISSGLVVVGTGRGAVVALNASNGSLKWRYETEAGNVSATPIIADGCVFAGGETGYMHVIDASTGKKVGQLGGGGGIYADGLYSDGVLYFGSGAVYAYE